MKLTPIAANQTEVELADGSTVFFRYRTPVAAHIPGRGYIKTACRWSVTTSKHITQFLVRNGANLERVAVVEQSELDAMGGGS